MLKSIGTSKKTRATWDGRDTLGWLVVVIILFSFGAALAQNSSGLTVDVVNNQPFAVRMPIALRAGNLKNGEAWKTSSGKPVQQDGDNVFFIADLPASSRQNFKLQSSKGRKAARKLFTVENVVDGVAMKFAGADLGRLSWQIVYRDSKPEELKGEPFSTKEDFSATFQPASIEFERVSDGPVFDTWRGTADSEGLQLTIELRAFHDGFLDINFELKNVGAGKVRDVYAAVLTRWQQQPGPKERSVCYDNRIKTFSENEWTNFRAGESRNWYVQRGVDWIKTNFAQDISAAWFNEFSQSFTVHQEATAKRPSRWVGANIPQIGHEAQTDGNDIFLLTEIARSNLRSYAERLEDNRLVDPGESVGFSSRLSFQKKTQTDEQVDNAFVAYASYAEQKDTADRIQYSIGVPHTRFGTNYFPYSTLGENFDIKKLPGMDRDGYWPAAADTVDRWQLFADDIRRDLRIAKTLGYELIRLHHLELLNNVDKAKRFDYLDFLFGEMRDLKLKVLFDAKVSAADTAELVKRYREDIVGVEVDNEVLIFGINDDAPDYWKRVYAAVKAVAPEIPVHLTGHTNTGAFDRLQKLGVPFDKIGQHAYADGLDSLPNMRGFSLAAASYGRRTGKEPIITEWNWRFLTRMTPEDRAKVYAPIFENVLKTRSMPVMYQFQFNESLAMNPRVLKGIRHYEQIWLSRRPKPEAFVMSGLIQKYGAPDHPNKLVDVEQAVVNLDASGRGTAQFTVTNTSGRQTNLKMTVESPTNLQTGLQGDATLRLEPKESKTVRVALQALPTDGSPAPLPGFYHAFLRLEDGELLRYGWVEARLAGEPKIDAESETNVKYAPDVFSFKLDRPLAVVYGDGSPIQDVETAYAVVNALESATGRPVKIYELKDLPKNDKCALVLIGTAATNELIKRAAERVPPDIATAKQFGARVVDSNNDWLVLSGTDNLDAERAAMDWTIRFWIYAKDAAARRVGLVEKDLPLGVDPQALP